MKRILFAVLLVASCLAMSAQEKMIVHEGSSYEAFTLANIDTVYFSSDKATMYVSVSSAINSIAVAKIDSITFGTVKESSADYVSVVYSGTSATVTIPSALKSVVSSSTNGADVTITSTGDAGIEYKLSGTSTDGSFLITSDKKFTLYLDGLTLTNPSGPAINSQNKPCNIILVDGTTNTLADGSSYDTKDYDQKGTIFSEGKLFFSGNGTLKVKGNYKHAICADNDIEIDGGTITVTGATKDAIHGETFTGTDGTINIASSGDGIEAEEGAVNISGGTYTITSAADCVKASYDSTDVSRDMTISGGTFTLSSSGETGTGLKGTGALTISGGKITINATGVAGKGMNFDGNISLTGGTIVANTSGAAYYDSDEADISSSSAIKSDGNLLIGSNSSSTVNVSAASTGNGGKGINVEGTFIMNGGTLKATTSGKIYSYSSSHDAKAKAIKVTGDITINGGNITAATAYGISNPTSNGYDGAEGIESKDVITINGGEITCNAYDDAINSANNLIVTGGKLYCKSSGNDGIDSNGTIHISGGLVIGIGTDSPEEGIDTDESGGITITGGTLITMGGQMNSIASLINTSASGAQRALVYGNSATSGTLLHIQDASSNDILDFTMQKTSTQNYMLISTPNFGNATYSIYTGGSYSGATTDFGGYLSGGTYTAGTSATTFSFTSNGQVVTAGNTSSGGGGGGGQPGGGGGFGH